MYFHVCGNCTRTAAGEKNNIKLHPKQEITMEFEKTEGNRLADTGNRRGRV